MAQVIFYVGSCNRPLPYFATANGKGIAAFRLDTETASIAPLGVTEGIDNPTYLAVAPDGKSLCATTEVLGWNEGLISAYAIDPATGALDYLSKQPTRGDIAAHLSFDATGRFVASVNYSVLPPSVKPNRSVVVYPRADDGAIAPATSEATHTGQGLDPARQDRSHPHCARWSLDNRYLIVADLGTDKLVTYRFDEQSGEISAHAELALPPGTGPRHLAFHPNGRWLYTVNELSSSVTSLAFDNDTGLLDVLATHDTVPPSALSHNHCSGIKLASDGRHLVVGNRGHDSIGQFAIDAQTGVATLTGTTPSGGKTPRDLAFDPSGKYLAVANQDSDLITLFHFDPANGALTPTGTSAATGTPTAISFLG